MPVSWAHHAGGCHYDGDGLFSEALSGFVWDWCDYGAHVFATQLSTLLGDIYQYSFQRKPSGLQATWPLGRWGAVSTRRRSTVGMGVVCCACYLLELGAIVRSEG